MTPRSEGTSSFVYTSFTRQLGNQMWRNKVAKLVENGESATGWLLFFHHTLPCGRRNSQANHFLFSNPYSCGSAVIENRRSLRLPNARRYSLIHPFAPRNGYLIFQRVTKHVIGSRA